MNIAEILRGLADKIASVEQGASIGIHRLAPVDVDNTDHTDDGVMIPPLQQKIELLKKSVGVPNAFDGEEQDQSDELDILKKNAGVAPIAIQVAEEDEPFEG
jgi:hypothetical protein